MHSASGRYRGVAWHQGYSGYTVRETGIHQRDEQNAAALAEASSGSAAVSLIGESSNPSAFVVKVAPPRGRIEYRFYDKTTFLLVRREYVVDAQRVVAEYSDFRPVDGRTMP